MVGTLPVSGSLTMESLAATLTKYEQDFAQLIALDVDTAAGSKGNLATFKAQDNQLGALAIVASGASSTGTKILSPTVYISGTQTKIDVYRLDLKS
ncbi:MAG: hypothetical protein ABR907_13155 [Terracidiphilus sp.]|jgi:hypothetical protein